MLTIKQIRMDGLLHPVGCETLPAFTWIAESDATDNAQSAYRLMIAAEASFAAPLLDTGWVESAQSAHVRFTGVALASFTRYHVRVRIRDLHGEESPWSEPADFVTSRTEGTWQARFITAEAPEDAAVSKGTYLRKAVALAGAVEQATLCATAHGIYHLTLNGEPVGADQMAPGWTAYDKHLCYQTYDVTHLLRPGENVLGAHLGAGWYKGDICFTHVRNTYGERTALFAELHIRCADGSEQVIATDETWLGCDSPVLFSEIYDGEVCDARLDQPGWDSPDFVPGENWHAAQALESDLSVLTPQSGCRVRITETLPVQAILRTPEGDTVLDFGQNLTGWVRFRAQGKAGELIHLRCFETLDAQGNAYFENLRKAKAEIRYTCAGREEWYDERFSFQGFRYAKLESWPGEVRREDFIACVVHSDMEETGRFACSNPLINRLESNIGWSLRDNFLDIPTDCPQRDERMGWTGDAQIFCRTAMFLRNAYPFFRKWLRDVAMEQTPEGGVPHVVPNPLQYYPVTDWLLSQGTHSAAAWADVAVIAPWNLYLTYGDAQVLIDQFDSMRKWIDFMRDHAVNDVWNYKLQFGDWVALDAQPGSYLGATPNDLTGTAYYAYSTGLFVRICRVLGRDELAETYDALYRRVVRRFRELFLDENGVMKVQTQTAHIVALHFRLVPPQGIPGTLAGLKRLLERENGHLVTGFVGTPYFCHALSDHGAVREAYDLLFKEDFPSWLYQVKAGATTIWEHWDGLKPDGTMWSPDMNSFNHYAYGAIGEWMYRVVAGIDLDPAAPGCRHLLLAPKTDRRLTWAEASFESVHGTVCSRWEAAGDRVTLSLRVPFGATATLVLEAGASEPSGLPFQKGEDGLLRAEVGSGEWRAAYIRKEGDPA